jgi:hypothetical protein
VRPRANGAKVISPGQRPGSSGIPAALKGRQASDLYHQGSPRRSVRLERVARTLAPMQGTPSPALKDPERRTRLSPAALSALPLQNYMVRRTCAQLEIPPASWLPWSAISKFHWHRLSWHFYAFRLDHLHVSKFHRAQLVRQFGGIADNQPLQLSCSHNSLTGLGHIIRSQAAQAITRIL